MEREFFDVFKDFQELTFQLFQPKLDRRRATTLKTAVRSVVEETLQLTDQLVYEEITGCEQKDSTSCGLWYLVVLELLLFGTDTNNWGNFWNDSIYEALGFLRMQYLHKALRLKRRDLCNCRKRDE
ncbi:hypothetical protein PHMEG_00018857 [Phytophthora megakarya]|uniref:Ubiquitin-like protease family profile domain-containing protein n=1 Tax=Phytophthora megakarya TaxID=4795 RepID=A0A225VT10_9STRA|nr:hypothetical protein PHMEG_00018857 [Phytophthora megakarya]